MFSNLRINFSILSIMFLISLSFVFAQETFFNIKDGLEISGLGKFESRLSELEITGNVTKIEKDYKIILLYGEKFIPEKKYVDNTFGVENFDSGFTVNIENERMNLKGDVSITLPALKGYIIKGRDVDITLREGGIFLGVNKLKIGGDSDFELNGIEFHMPEGVVFDDVVIVGNVLKSITLKNSLNEDITGIDIGNVRDISVEKDSDNYVKVEFKEGYELIGKGAKLGDFALKEDQALKVDSSGRISLPGVVGDTISLVDEDKEIVINKLERNVQGVTRKLPFARGEIKVVSPGESIRNFAGAAVQFGKDRDENLNLVFKDFSAAEIPGFGKIQEGKPYPNRRNIKFVDRAVFYNGNEKTEVVYEGESWKEISTNKVVKTKLGSNGIRNDIKVDNVLNLLGNVRGIGRGAFLEYIES